jgi:hypothetical protein
MKAHAAVNEGAGIISLYLSGIRSFLGTTLRGASEIEELCYLDCSNSNIRGNISELALLEGFREIDLEGTQVVGNLTSLGGTASTALRKLNIVDTAIEGDVVNLAGYLMMTDLRMDGSAIEGDAADLATLVALQYFFAHGCVTLIGSAETMTAAMDELLVLDLGGTQVTGDLAAIVAATPLNTYLDISGSLIAGDVADLIDMAAADGYIFVLDGCAVDAYTDGGDWSGHGGWDMSLKDLGLTEAMVDDILEDMAGTLAVHASGSITLDDAVMEGGDSVTVDDGQGVEEIFVFDMGTRPTGRIALETSGGVRAEPSDGDTLTIDDGVNDPVTFEFDDNASVEAGNVLVAMTPGVPEEHAAGTINFGTYQNADKVTIFDGFLPTGPSTFQADTGNRPTGTIVFAGQPTDGHIVTIDDGLNTPITYEFDDNATWNPLRQRVVIGGDAEATRDALIAAINAISAVNGSEVYCTPGGADTIRLNNNYHHVNGNQAVIKDDANITVTGLAGGAAPGANVTAGNILVAVEIDKSDVVDGAAVMSALSDAINASSQAITSEIDGVDDEQLNLTNDVAGAYNEPIYETGTTFDKAGMLGGLNSTVGNPTMAALEAAIAVEEGAGRLNIECAFEPSDNTRFIRNTVYRAAGNIAMVAVGTNVQAAGMAGGIDPGDNVVAPNIPVPLMDPAAPEDAVIALVDAINSSALDIDATVDGVNPLKANLVNQHGGVAGNVPITVSREFGTFVPTGMENGTDDGIVDPCYIDLSGNAVPSADGLVAMGALEINGWTVIVEEA